MMVEAVLEIMLKRKVLPKLNPRVKVAVLVNSAIIDMQYSVLPEYGKLDLIF